MNFARRSFASWALGTLGAVAGFAGLRSARAEESTDRAGRLQASNEVLKLQRHLRRTMKRLEEEIDLPYQTRGSAISCLKLAASELEEAQGYLTQGKSDE